MSELVKTYFIELILYQIFVNQYFQLVIISFIIDFFSEKPFILRIILERNDLESVNLLKCNTEIIILSLQGT